MTAETTMSIGVIVLLLGIVLNLYGFFNGRKKDIKGDAREIYEIRESLVKIDMKTGQLNTTMNDIRTDVRSISSRIGALEQEVSVLKSKVEQMERGKEVHSHEQ